MKYPIYTYIYFKEIFLFENCCSLFLWRKFDKIMLVYKKSCESLKSAYSDFTVALMFLLFAKERNTNLCHFWTLFISNINKAKEWRKNFYRFLAEIRNTQAYRSMQAVDVKSIFIITQPKPLKNPFSVILSGAPGRPGMGGTD